MTDEPALLAAVAAAPDDDTPRLVYADWLDDHDRPERAEFVRVQCRLAAMSPGDDGYAELLDRQDELALWLRTFEPHLGPDLTSPLRVAQEGYSSYARGFPHLVSSAVFAATPAVLKKTLAALGRHLAASPARTLDTHGLNAGHIADLLRSPLAAGLRNLHPPAAREVAEALAASPHVRQLRGLDFGGVLNQRTAAVLARANFPWLTELSVTISANAPLAVAALAASAWFKNLRVLGVGAAEQNRGGHLEALAAVPPLPNLHTLRLETNQFVGADLAALARSKSFPALTALNLTGNSLGADGAASLAAADWPLRSLNLRGCGLTYADVRVLLSGPLLDGVRVLELGGNKLTAPAVKALAASPKLAQVRHLTLAFSKIGKDGFAALGASPYLKNLTRLDVNVFADENGRAAVEDTCAFLDHVDAPNLRRLDLGGQPVGLAGVEALATRLTFADLRWLGVQEGRIGNAGLAALAASPQLQQLVYLDVGMNQITDAAALLDPGTFPRLAQCKLSGNKLTLAAAAELAARPGVEVYNQFV